MTAFARRDFPDGAALAPAFAQWTAERLAAGIAARGAALLIVSGGRTPLRYFRALSDQPIDWSRVAVTLADERRVADDSPRSNAKLVRKALLHRARRRRLVRSARRRAARPRPGARRRQRAPRQLAFARRRRRARHGRRRPHRLVVSRRRRARRGDGPGGARAGRADQRRGRAGAAPDAHRPRPAARARDRAAYRGRGQVGDARPGARPPDRSKRCRSAPCCAARPTG